ncbi:hypothetical protein AKJ57_06170 [candidate division MSBL1 archaeon SCGC-AAA259A05]|uniref:RNA polymerase sigma-70 region 4 domain-containing protein n=1 Tax=candidate division MSBL1 archaeon SCGC-AAA259A05 TaxID=1698259 RepID=A0A133U3X1_9EURY|nr:hypothetical protein AKJ57_06170 [candidate division MSBL1 archaeon SCGC-AAA259A05]
MTQKEISEIDEWIEENPLSQALLKKSSLKKGELKALLLYFGKEDISFKDLASELGINRSGAWKRWKRGYNKIIESFYTLELAAYSGILEPEVTELLTEDLRSYLEMVREDEDLEVIRERIERRMAELEELRP